MSKFFMTPKGVLTTLLVVAAVGVMVRLGFWQLDRLDQRRSLNARVSAQLDVLPLDLVHEVQVSDVDALGDALKIMEYRSVQVTGVYDHSQEIALRNQTHDNRLGVHIFTPLKISGTDQVVLVDRGWISMDDFNRGDWSSFETSGEVTVNGVIRLSRTRPDMGRQVDPPHTPGERLTAFSIANLDRIGEQMPEEILPVYVHQTPNQIPGASLEGPPYPEELNIVLTEGSHMGYALQWFAFAALLAGGYPFFVRREVSSARGEYARGVQK